jgi:hypothetical protein
VLAGRYELEHEIGDAPTGALWRARDTVLGRTVAVKRLGVTADGASVDLERAEREANLASNVTHRNVVAVYDVVEEGADHWLVMEHVEGLSLAALIDTRGAVAPEPLAAVAAQAASGLAATHARGIVHRAVTPASILLTPDRVVKLTDFGFARSQTDADHSSVAMGSPAYLAPEVITGRPATPASDVWSLGATMFHALRGTPPYDPDADMVTTMTLVVDEAPPRLDGGSDLDALVSEMMDRDPERRPTMAEVERRAESASGPDPTEALTSLSTAVVVPDPAPTAVHRPVSPPPAPARAPSRESPHRGAWWAAGAVLVVLVVAGYAIANRSGDQETSAPTASDTPSATSDAPDEQPTAAPPAEPDGPSTDELQDFVSDYLQTAESDPAQGFDLLTADYQASSGGFEPYEDFWSQVDDVEVEQIAADPDSGAVAYTYSYAVDGERTTESRTAQVVDTADGLRIAGSS